MTEQKTTLMEVAIFCHNGKSMLRGKLPDGKIGRIPETDITNMLGAGIIMRQSGKKLVGKILIEEQLHDGGIETNLRSRSAAKARQARISSRVRSGKSFRS